MTRALLLCDRIDVAGGVERFCCTLAGHLVGRGWQVAIGSAAAPGTQPVYALDPRVRLLAAPVPSAASAGWRRLDIALRQWRFGRAMAALVRAERPDVLLLNGLTLAVPVLLAAPEWAARSVACDHNHFGARSHPWRWLRALLYPRLAAVVSLTEADRPRFAALNRRCEVIANASTLRAEAPGVVRDPVVLAVGRHVRQKGLDLLLAAWPAVVAEVPRARLVIVGEGPLTPALQAQAQALGIADAVDWRGSTREIEALYRSAAVFALPSRYEGLPLALLEAQALGLPAVAFDCPTGPRDVLGNDGTAGVLVPSGDVAGFARALVELLNDPERRRRMALAGMERSRALFSPERHFARWTALLAEVAAR